MTCEKETLKAMLMIHDGISFWIRKGWYNADGLTSAGWKAFHIAKRAHCQHLYFDAMKEFEVMHKTEKAVLLRCEVESPVAKKTQVEFWLPYSMTCNFEFVARKIREIECGFPFIGTRVKWSGGKHENQN
jgi:hypothetical protein